MAAPKGNQFWLARSSHGRKPAFSDPDVLWKACLEFFQWCEDNPLYEEKVFCFQGAITTHQLPKMRAMTISALCLFLDICDETWSRYRKSKDLSGIVMRAEKFIYNQKFTGAAAEMLNSNIIARDLGLKDKKEHDHQSSDGSMTPGNELTGEALRKELDRRGLKVEIDE